MPKTLPATVTHLDFIKTFAVIMMIIDHIGSYFFPDQLWWRAFGRIGGAPIWFFLIGYAISRELPTKLFVGAMILAVTDVIFVGDPFALNALFTIIFLRLTIDPAINFITQSRYVFVIASVLMAFAYFLTNMIFEYGTLALLFAVAGYLTRHKAKLLRDTYLTEIDYLIFMVFTFMMFCLLQNATFGFDETQLTVMAILTAIILFILCTMRPMTFPQIQTPVIVKLLHIGGRKTLEIYVIHLFLFKVAAIIIFSL
jgi:hypothetical protein